MKRNQQITVTECQPDSIRGQRYLVRGIGKRAILVHDDVWAPWSQSSDWSGTNEDIVQVAYAAHARGWKKVVVQYSTYTSRLLIARPSECFTPGGYENGYPLHMAPEAIYVSRGYHSECDDDRYNRDRVAPICFDDPCSDESEPLCDVDAQAVTDYLEEDEHHAAENTSGYLNALRNHLSERSY